MHSSMSVCVWGSVFFQHFFGQHYLAGPGQWLLADNCNRQKVGLCMCALPSICSLMVSLDMHLSCASAEILQISHAEVAI